MPDKRMIEHEYGHYWKDDDGRSFYEYDPTPIIGGIVAVILALIIAATTCYLGTN